METNKMETRDIFPLLMSMSLPMVLSMLVQSLYNIITVFMYRIWEQGLSRQCHWHSRCRISCCLWQSESVSGLLPSYRSVWEKRIRNGQMRLPQWGCTYADPLCTVCDPGPCDHRTIYRIIYKGTRGDETGM